nr:MAG TPA: hypothetical protein [Caudoviricetes sp.]
MSELAFFRVTYIIHRYFSAKVVLFSNKTSFSFLIFSGELHFCELLNM